MGDAAVSLAEAEADALLGEQFPDVPGPTRWLGEGEDFRAFERGGLVFRFPQRAETAAWLQTEVRVLARIGDRLGVAVPRYQHLGRPGPRFPFVFGGYPLLQGTPASLAAASARLAAELGAFLTALHGSQAEGVPDRRDLWAPGRHLARLQAEAGPTLCELPPALRERCSAFLDAAELPAECPTHCLIHGDLEAEHLLLDDSGGLAAVLDWSDVCLGDPARDLGGLWAWGGEAFLRELLHHYPSRDPGLLSRVRFLGRCFALLDHTEALAEDERGRGLALRQLENAFPETP